MQDRAADAATRLDPTAHNVSSAGAASLASEASSSVTAGYEENVASPFLPDEVLQALAREPPSPATTSSARIVGSGTSSARHSIAFDRTFLVDVPGLAAPAQRDRDSARSGLSSSGLSSGSALIDSSPGTSLYGSSAAILHGRRKTLRGLVSSRVRLSTLGPGRFVDNASNNAHPAPIPRSRGSGREEAGCVSAWSQIAMAASAPALERSMSASSTQSTPFASTASINSTSSSRMARSHTADGQSGVGVRRPAMMPDLERALADLDLRASLRPANSDRQAPNRGVPADQSRRPMPADSDLASGSQADFLVAVVGPRGVGKSTLIRRAFKRSGENSRILQSCTNGAEAVVSSASFTMAGIRRTIDIISLDSELLEMESKGGLAWPAEVPQAEAVMVCYDASDLDALSSLSISLQTFWTDGADVPLIVLASKSSDHDAVDPGAAAELCNHYGAGIVRLDGGADDPQRKEKESFSWLIRQIMDNRGETHFYAALATPADGPPREQYFPPLPPQLPVASSPFPVNLGAAEPTVQLSVTETAPVSIANQQEHRPSFVRRNLLFSSEDLIDKFLFASIAGDDEDFVNAFLITFRRFERPARVLGQLVERFEFVSQQDSDLMLKRYGQLRLCSTLSTWLQSYPGDFSDADTLEILRPFVADTLTGPDWLRHHAFELAPLLPGLEALSDPDLCWSTPSPSTAEARTAPFPRNDDKTPTALEISLSSAAGSSDALSLDSRGSSTGASSAPMSRQVSAVSAVLVDASNAISELRAEDIAVQITRLAWSMWTGITPRDAIRHVLAKRERSVDSPVMRCVSFVNHLARWVATLVLVQSRPRQRALMIAHFVVVAAELRSRENYDSLAGVLAGLNHQAVHRLSDSFRAAAERLDGSQAHTENDVRPKKLRSLNLLLSPAKSFAAYRLAVSTRSRETLPYLGVVLQDLTVINETSSDFEQQLVNWSKMAQLGRAAAILLDCPRKAPPLPSDSVFETYIMDLPLLNDEKLYALSYAYQPREQKSSPTRSRLQEWLS